MVHTSRATHRIALKPIHHTHCVDRKFISLLEAFSIQPKWDDSKRGGVSLATTGAIPYSIDDGMVREPLI